MEGKKANKEEGSYSVGSFLVSGCILNLPVKCVLKLGINSHI